MRRLDANSISSEFNAAKEKFSRSFAASGLDEAVTSLSLVIGDMKKAGMDVELTLFGDASEQAFDLFAGGGLTVPVTGILRMGPIHRLIGIATKENNIPVLKIGISEFDIRFQGVDATSSEGVISGKLRALTFDLRKEDGLEKLQKEIIRHSARNAVLNEHDVAGVFDNGAALRKPSLQLPKPQ